MGDEYGKEREGRGVGGGGGGGKLWREVHVSPAAVVVPKTHAANCCDRAAVAKRAALIRACSASRA